MRFLSKISFIFSLLFGLSLQAQSDSLPYRLFKENVVLYTDIGFNSAPFSLQDNYGLGVKKIKYRNNVKPALGFGMSYKWFGLRIGFALPVQLKSESKFGNLEYFDVGLKFNIKQVFVDIDLRSYKGYAVKDAYKWNDSLTSDQPNLIQPDTRSVSFSTNVWWFRDKNFKMQAVLGKVGHFTGEAKTWYYKSTLNFFGVGDDYQSLVPTELTDSSERVNAQSIGAIDIGFIPGFAYANRINNWQFSIFTGLGGVIQSKFYAHNDLTRGFLGIAPRVDFRVVAGYTKPKYFVLFTTDFDIKSVQIQDLKYNQTFYNLQLVAGIRISNKKSVL